MRWLFGMKALANGFCGVQESSLYWNLLVTVHTSRLHSFIIAGAGKTVMRCVVRDDARREKED